MTRFYRLDPHPDVLKKWLDVGYLPAEDWLVDTQECTALAAMGLGKRQPLKDPVNPDRRITTVEYTEEQPNRKINRSVHRLYRSKTGFMYTEILDGESFGGDKHISHGRTVGKYHDREFAKNTNRETGQIIITGFRTDGGKDVFYIPFTTGQFTDPSTGEKITIKDLPISETATFYVITPNRKYALSGITLDEYLNSSYEYLVEWGQMGKRPERKVEEPIVAKGKKAVKEE